MNESTNKRPVMVGLFVFIGLLFLLAGILTIGNLHETFKRKIKLTTLFEDVSGLQTGNNVWFSGVKIGTVNSMQFYGKSQVRVIIKIEEKAEQYIRKDAKVKISTDGLIGNKIIVIYGGTSLSEAVEEGDTLGVELTFSAEDMMNTFQENNKNLLSITSDFKILSKKLTNGEGTLGKLLNDNSTFNNINAATASLQKASEKAQLLASSLSDFSTGLNKKGTLANELVNDTVIFYSIKASVLQLQEMSDSAGAFINNLNYASTNSKSALGALLHDDETGAHLKDAIKNLDSSSVKLDADLEAMQHNFLLRGFFKKQAKEQKKAEEQLKTTK